MAECNEELRDCGKEFKGYPIATGYMGYVPWYKNYILFKDKDDYINYIKGDENESN